MFNKKLYITIITIISILILSISCGNSMTNSTNGGNVENNGGSISGGGETIVEAIFLVEEQVEAMVKLIKIIACL